MADFSNAKSAVGSVFPETALDSDWSRVEPLVSPEQLVSRFLWGIPLVSKFTNPLTKKPYAMDEPLLKDYIIRSVSNSELETGIAIFPVQYREKQPFIRQDYEALGYFVLHNRPVFNVTKLSVTPSNNVDVYVVPNDWVETAYLAHGQINIVPLTIAFQNGGFIPSQSSGGAAFLNILGQRGWIPAYWQIEYTAGFPDGNVPRVVNELIGCNAAIDVLSTLAATYARSTSHSLGIDGFSQSISTPGPEIFTTRIKQLTDRKTMLIGKIKTLYGLKLFSGAV